MPPVKSPPILVLDETYVQCFCLGCRRAIRKGTFFAIEPQAWELFLCRSEIETFEDAVIGYCAQCTACPDGETCVETGNLTLFGPPDDIFWALEVLSHASHDYNLCAHRTRTSAPRR
jgi:hypothetical protein